MNERSRPRTELRYQSLQCLTWVPKVRRKGSRTRETWRRMVQRDDGERFKNMARGSNFCCKQDSLATESGQPNLTMTRNKKNTFFPYLQKLQYNKKQQSDVAIDKITIYTNRDMTFLVTLPQHDPWPSRDKLGAHALFWIWRLSWQSGRP